MCCNCCSFSCVYIELIEFSKKCEHRWLRGKKELHIEFKAMKTLSRDSDRGDEHQFFLGLEK